MLRWWKWSVPMTSYHYVVWYRHMPTAIISLYHEISTRTRISPFPLWGLNRGRNNQSVMLCHHAAIVTERSFLRVPVIQFVTTICTCIVTLMKRVHWLCVQLPKLKIGFWLFVKKNQGYMIWKVYFGSSKQFIYKASF